MLHRAIDFQLQSKYLLIGQLILERQWCFWRRFFWPGFELDSNSHLLFDHPEQWRRRSESAFLAAPSGQWVILLLWPVAQDLVVDRIGTCAAWPQSLRALAGYRSLDYLFALIQGYFLSLPNLPEQLLCLLSVRRERGNLGQVG